MYCLDAKNGEIKWTYRTKDEVHPIMSSIVASNGMLYFGANNFSLYVLNPDTGKELWNFKTENPVWSTPSFYGSYVYFASFDGKVFCLGEKPAKMKVTKGIPKLKLGDFFQFEAIGLDEKDKPMKVHVRWSVEPSEIGSIDGNGKFTALAKGKATIKAWCNGVGGLADIEVY